MKSWIEYNESNIMLMKPSREVIQEIVWYLHTVVEGESKEYSINKDLLERTDRLILSKNINTGEALYEAGTDDIEVFINELLEIAKNDKMWYKEMVGIYKEIRHLCSAFPSVSEIVENYLGIIESGFNYYIQHMSPHSYEIRLRSKHGVVVSLEEFVKYCMEVKRSSNRIDQKSVLKSCERYVGDTVSTADFKIKLNK